MAAFQALGLEVSYESGDDLDKAKATAQAADVAFVFGSAHTGEGHDRPSLNLEGQIDAIIPEIGAVQSKTVAVISVPGSILTDWRDKVPAILTNLLPGEQVGNALADLVFGKIPPQAKLPVTFPTKDNEQGMTESQYPGVKTATFDLEATYTEGQLSGYRWYDKHGVKPAFPFGHGLSYGAFEFGAVKVSGRTVTFTVSRSQGTSACETPQIYFSYPAAKDDPKVPAKVLRHFQKTCEATTTVTYQVSDADISNWDVEAKVWKLTPGQYIISVGSSSQDIRQTVTTTFN